MTQSDIEFDLGSVTMSCTAEDIAATFTGMLQEMRAAAVFVRADEREALRRIMSQESGTFTVAEVFPDFARNTDALTSLRRLRTAQFIRPAGRDMWERTERIAIKPFARLVWDRLGEDAFFAPDKPADAAAEEVDLAHPGVDEPGSKQTNRLKNKQVAVWEDDDVLDFLKDDTPI